MNFARRVAPAVLLTVLAPIVAEFLLGDFSVRNLPLVVALLPLYGGGALLIREVARRAGRGWPAILLLGTAYSLLEEGFLTQSLFNPNYVGQRLLDYGYIAALGTSLNWSLFVLSIHVVWSIATVFLATFALAIVFMLAEPFARARGLAPAVSVLARVVCQAIAAVLIVRWARARNWGPRHYLAGAAGTTITYSLFGLSAFLRGHTNLGVPTDRIDVAGQVALTIVVLSLIWWGSLRLPP